MQRIQRHNLTDKPAIFHYLVRCAQTVMHNAASFNTCGQIEPDRHNNIIGGGTEYGSVLTDKKPLFKL